MDFHPLLPFGWAHDKIESLLCQSEKGTKEGYHFSALKIPNIGKGGRNPKKTPRARRLTQGVLGVGIQVNKPTGRPIRMRNAEASNARILFALEASNRCFGDTHFHVELSRA